jgi:hypothetical protein
MTSPYINYINDCSMVDNFTVPTTTINYIPGFDRYIINNATKSDIEKSSLYNILNETKVDKYNAKIATENNDINILKRIFYINPEMLINVSFLPHIAVLNRNKEIIEFLYYQDIEFDTNEIEFSASNNDFDMVKYLVELGIEYEINLYKWALETENFEMMELFWKDYYRGHLINWAYIDADLKITTWLYEKGIRIDQEGINEAVENDNIEVVKFFWELEGEDNIKPTEIKVSKYHIIDVLEFLWNKGVEIDDNNILNLFRNGDYEAVEFMLDNNLKVTEHMVKIVSKNGNLDIIELLQDNDVEIKQIFLDVAKYGGLSNVVEAFEM